MVQHAYNSCSVTSKTFSAIYFVCPWFKWDQSQKFVGTWGGEGVKEGV